MSQPDQHPHVAVSKTRKKTSHTFHLLMTCCTCGVWAVLVWPWVILWNNFGPRRRTVTRYR